MKSLMEPINLRDTRVASESRMGVLYHGSRGRNGEICFSPSIRLFGVLNQGNQTAHLVARLTRVHQV
jgi:hypothetical protein